MAIGDTLASAYARVEDGFFNIVDWMDEKGIPIYAYVNALEDRGIPAFPVTIAMVVLLVVLLFWFLFIPAQLTTTIGLSLVDNSGNSLTQVDVKIVNDSGNTIFEGRKSHGDSIQLDGITPGGFLSITGIKENFETGYTQIQVKDTSLQVVITLDKQIRSQVAQLRLIDSESGIPIPGAQVTLKWGTDFVRTGQTDANGLFSALGVPTGEEVQLEIIADNYETIIQPYTFAEGSVPSIAMVPRGTALFGSANLIVKTFDKTTQIPLSDVLLRIINPQNEQGLAEAITVNGQFVLDLPKGTIFKIIATKSGYTVTSTEEFTLREDPTQIDIELQEGGNQIHVTVTEADSNISIFDAAVGLYTESAELLLEQKTPFTGGVDFLDLNPDQNYFVTAYKSGYVPQTIWITPLDTSEITLALETASTSNTGTLNVIVTDSTGFAANNTGLHFYELVVGKPIPTGLPTVLTEYDGFATIEAPANRNILVVAQKGFEKGDANIFIQPGMENNVAVRMKPIETAKLLRVLGLDGNPFWEGTALVKSVTGAVLLDENLSEEGTVIFDAKQYKNVDITIFDYDGNSFSEQVNVEGKTEIIVQWRENNVEALAPPITFLGIEDAEGKPVDGITPETDYWLKFQVDWIKGEYRGGLHFRVGNDQVTFADSEQIGITGFSATNVASFFYGRSYTAFPAPGNEAADFGNVGKAGNYNKWLELYYTNPEGSQLVRVKVRLKEGFSQMTLPIHYRDWSSIDGQYFRSPQDSELGRDAYSNTKTGLYAITFDEEVSLFTTKEQCMENVCAEYRFIATDGEATSPEEFQALRGRVYALEISLRAKEEQGILLRASTDKTQPKLFFTGTEVETFTEFFDTDETDSVIEINDLSVLENGVRTARVYFKPFKAGNAHIKSEVIGEHLSLKKDFYFNIFEQSEMILSIEPEPVLMDEPFTINITDQNTGNPVTKATIHVKDETGSIVASTVGNNSQGNGLNGQYAFTESLGAGTFTIKATAFGFAPANYEFTISAHDMLRLPEEIFVSIPKNQQSGTESAFIENVSNQSLNEITIEIQKPDSWPLELDVVGQTSSVLKARQKGTMDITGTYIGDSNHHVVGTADLMVHAMVAGKYPAIASTRVTVSYNEPFDSNCLSFDKKELTVYLAGNQPLNQWDSGYSPYGNAYRSPYNYNSPAYMNPANRSPYYDELNQNQYYANPGQYNTPYSSQYLNNNQYDYDTYNEPWRYNSGYPQQSNYISQNYNNQNYSQDPYYQQSAYDNSYYNQDYANNQYSPRFFSNNDSSYYNNSQYSPFNNNYNYSNNSPYGGSGNIFSNVYSAYDQTAKEIELQVTNNCPHALQLTGKALEKIAGGGDNGLEIVVPSFSIQPNETIPTTIHISNKRDRMLPQQQNYAFEVLFEADSINKSIPLNVIIWDSRFAIATSDSIVLFLSQSQKGEPVITSSPLFLRNIGAEDIENLRVEVGGNSYLEGVSLRVIPFGNVPVLPKGQVVFPPKLVVAEKRGGTEKGRLVHSYLTVTGEIDGKVHVLRNIDVWIHVSALNCLFLTPVDDLEFISTESRFGVIDKKVRIRNTCEEAVRVVGIEPNQIGANGLLLVPITTDYLERDLEAEFIVRLAKQGDYKNENLGISVAGLTQLTQKFIQSNRLQSRVELGEMAVSTGLASEPYTMDVCIEEGIPPGTKESVRFPKISRNADCEKGYCDATQAAQFLGEKLDNKINQVQNAIGNSNNQLENFIGCVNTAEQKACTFTELGVPSDSFDLFLQNDLVAVELLQKEFAEKGPASLTNYSVGYCSGIECDAKSVAQTGFPNFLFVSNLLRGCGKYRIKLNGAAFVQQNQIRNEGFILSINVQQRELTPECTNQIENVLNFLPTDEGMTGDNPFGTWVGLVEAELKLSEVGAAFAQEFFGTVDGRVYENTGSNKIHLEFGEVSNGLVKIELEPGTLSDEPKTTLATINQALNTEGTNQKDLAKEAANSISALKKQRIQAGKGCIAKDHSYFILGSTEKLGDLELKGPDTINVLPNELSCIDLNVISPIKESVKLRTNKKEIMTKNNGLARITIRPFDDHDKILNEEDDAIELEYNDTTKNYTVIASLCVEGNDQFSLSIKAEKIEVTAQSTIDPIRQSNTKKITYQVCGIHPYDLVNKLSSLKPGEYFGTPGWKGEPNSTNLKDIINAMADQGDLKDEDKLLQGPGVDEIKQKVGEQAQRDKHLSAIFGFPIPGIGGEWTNPLETYWTPCITTSAACNGIKTVGFYGWLWGPIFDCVGPALWMAAPYTEGTWAEGLKGVREFILEKMGGVSSYIAEKVEGLFPGTPGEKQEGDLVGILGGVSGKSLIKGLKYNNYLTKSTSSVAAKRIAEDIADQVVEQQMKSGLLARRELKSMLEKELTKNLKETFRAKIAADKSKLFFNTSTAAKKATLETLTQEAVKKSNLNEKLIEFSVKNQGKLKAGSTLANQAASLQDVAAAKMAESYGPITVQGTVTKNYENVLSGFTFDDIKAPAGGAFNIGEARNGVWTRFMERIRNSASWSNFSAAERSQLEQSIQTAFQTQTRAISGAADEAAMRAAFGNARTEVSTALRTLEQGLSVPAQQAVRDIADQIVSKSGTKVSGGQLDNMIQRIETSLAAGGEKNVERGFKAGINAAPDNVQKGIRSAFKDELAELTSKVIANTSEEGIGWFKRFRRFLGGLGRGIACGVLSNAVGLKMAQATLDEPAKVNADTSELKGTPAIGKDGQPIRTEKGDVLQNIELQKGATYKITVKEIKKDDGKTHKTFEFNKVKDLSMIPKNATSLNTDCKGEFADKGLDGYAFSLNPEGKQTTQKEQSQYYLSARTLEEEARDKKIPQILLGTAMELEQRHQIPNACDPSGLWKSDPSAAGDQIACAATKLATYYSGSSDDSSVRKIFDQYYDPTKEAPLPFLEDAVATYRKWKSYKTS